MKVWTCTYPHLAPNTHPRLHIAGTVAGDTHSLNCFSVLRGSSLSGSDFPIYSGNNWREPTVPDRHAGRVFAMSPTGAVEMAFLIRGIFSARLLECESGGRSLALFPVGPH